MGKLSKDFPISQKQIRAMAEEFVDFLPPKLPQSLPKLTLSLKEN